MPNFGQDAEQLECLYIARREWNGTTALEICLAFPLKFNGHLPYEPEIPFLGTYPREMKARLQKGICKKVYLQ